MNGLVFSLLQLMQQTVECFKTESSTSLTTTAWDHLSGILNSDSCRRIIFPFPLHDHLVLLNISKKEPSKKKRERTEKKTIDGDNYPVQRNVGLLDIKYSFNAAIAGGNLCVPYIYKYYHRFSWVIDKNASQIPIFNWIYKHEYNLNKIEFGVFNNKKKTKKQGISAIFMKSMNSVLDIWKKMSNKRKHAVILKIITRSTSPKKCKRPFARATTK